MVEAIGVAGVLSVRQWALVNMKNHYREEPHAPLMEIVSEFLVAFSEDDEPPV